MFSEDGRYIFGGFLDYARRDPAIFSSDLAARSPREIRSRKDDLTWLDGKLIAIDELSVRDMLSSFQQMNKSHP